MDEFEGAATPDIPLTMCLNFEYVTRHFCSRVQKNRGGVLVVGGQTLCLLLTLLAVPVFYSLFDDLARNRVWGRIRDGWHTVFGRVRRRAASAAAGLLSKQ